MSNVADARTLREVSRQRAEGRLRGHLANRVGIIVAFVVVLFFAALFIAPLYWMVMTSLKTTPEVFRLPPVWWPSTLRWGNYPDALDYFPFLRYAENTLRIAVPVALGTTLSSALVAYGFSRLRWR